MSLHAFSASPRSFAGVIAAIAALAVAWGVSDDASAQTDPPVLGSHWLAVHQPARVDLLAVDRTSPEFVTVRFRVVNLDDAPLDIYNKFTWASDRTDSVSAVTLVDGQEFKRYYPLRTTDDGECVCSLIEDQGYEVPQRGEQEYFASFPAPPGDRTTVLVPNVSPFMDVPIGDKPGPVTPPEGQPERDPAKLEVKPDTVALQSFGTAVDDSREEVQTQKKIEVRLRSDVLFKVNSAALGGPARESLEVVARKIDRAEATEVRVDGYTDTSGNDAINNPLSRRRAESVRDVLDELVTRDDVTFTAEGHGSADPIADNGTEEGRKRNRRVTVRFAR